MTYLILVAGVFCSAISFVFNRESTEPPVMLAAYRVLFAGILLLPVYIRDRKRYATQSLNTIWKRTWLPGLVLGIHFIAGVVGARLRGQTVTVLNMGQFIIAGIVGYFLYQEVPAPTFYLSSTLLLLAMGLIVTQSDT